MVLGERFRAELSNQSGVESLIHWHGLTPPIAQDGVPMLSQPPLKPGETYGYDFANTRAGTHWMHSHVGLQEQLLLAAPLIVRETAEPVFDEQEHVVMLHDFTFRDPAEILAELQGGGGAHAGHAMDHGAMDYGSMDHSSGAPAPMAAAMLNDIVYDAYLANDRTLDDPEVVQVEKGGYVRLRIINGAAASNMWIDTGLLDADLIAVDGNAVHPVTHSFFPLAIAQRADLRIRIPAEGGSFPIVFRPEGVAGRAAIILATPGAVVSREFFIGVPAPALTLDFEALLRPVAQIPDEPVSRTEMLMLTGGGADYSWGLNGKASMHDTIFTVRMGERIEVMMHNMTTMAHPMHLHGHYFKVTAIGGNRIDGALRDTVLVPPNETVSIVFDADNPGTWAFHCHHLYHMNAGMMGAVAYTEAA
jgi:FtsP/CotA-like multicopper oxidase with cupredoxin domain